jgi:hypothetical protein
MGGQMGTGDPNALTAAQNQMLAASKENVNTDTLMR